MIVRDANMTSRRLAGSPFHVATHGSIGDHAKDRSLHL